MGCRTQLGPDKQILHIDDFQSQTGLESVGAKANVLLGVAKD